jgi:hypothetical protein
MAMMVAPAVKPPPKLSPRRMALPAVAVGAVARFNVVVKYWSSGPKAIDSQSVTLMPMIGLMSQVRIFDERE